jgi:2-haloalkanoic acid dehalogenase type II
MPRFRALLLDFYGTLVDEDTDVIQAICQEVCRNAQAASPAEVARTWSSIFRELTSASHGPDFRLQRDLAQMSLGATVSRYRSAADPDTLLEAQFSYWQRPRIQPDTQELLATTLPACVVSNIDRADLTAALAHHGLAGRFAYQVTSQDARAYKPRPEMFITALALLGISPDEVIHVGDSLSSDVAGAQRLGIAVAWVNRSRHPVPTAGPRTNLRNQRPQPTASPARWLSQGKPGRSVRRAESCRRYDRAGTRRAATGGRGAARCLAVPRCVRR